MKDEKRNYYEYQKIQIITVIVAMLTLFLLLIEFYPLDTTQRVITFILLQTLALIYIWFIRRKALKMTVCPNCDAELLEVLEVAKSKKLAFNFCPVCGHHVQI